ncbi:MAG: metallophosphoesterase family protein [bacterium]|nr:metallophosphoesterase family protein [bacterium]
MQFVALGGIRGNVKALEAVLEDVDRAGILTVVNVGDSCVGYPWPNETIERLAHAHVTCVQGELDRAIVRYMRKADSMRRRLPAPLMTAVEWTYDQLSSSNLESVHSFRKTAEVRLEELCILVCHGTPASASETLAPDTDLQRLRRIRESANADIVVCGRSPHPFSRMVDGCLFVSPGSVGHPVGPEGGALYAVVDTDADPWSVEFRRADYDRESALSAAAASGLSPSELFAEEGS